MKVRYRKGVATHPDPESCGGVREGVFEALTGETAGQPLSREIESLERHAVMQCGRQHVGWRVSQAARRLHAVGDPEHAGKSFAQELGDLVVARGGTTFGQAGEG